MSSEPTSSHDHQGLEILSIDQCWERLAERPVGRVAFVEQGDPIILPVNHRVIDHRIVIRTAKGALLHQALRNRHVAFEVDHFDEETRSGWSVLVRGTAQLAEDVDEVEAEDLDAWADSIERDDWIVIIPDEVSGREIDPNR